MSCELGKAGLVDSAFLMGFLGQARRKGKKNLMPSFGNADFDLYVLCAGTTSSEPATNYYWTVWPRP
jgi:hypothetical protein